MQVTSPNGGETWKVSGTKRIRWEVEDEDEGLLTAAVQYSIEGGAAWRAVAVDHAETEVALDLALLTGSEQAMVRVTASDGLNTVSDVSDEVFTVESKPPEVYLASPVEGAEYPYGWPVLLEGYFTNGEDGADLDEARATWSSSLDGPLGQGGWLSVDSLAPGRHRLSFSVRDSQSLTGVAEVNIVILNPDGSAPRMPPTVPLGWLAGLLAYAVLGGRRARGHARRRG